ncbi:MAG: hypothetical protein ACYC2U_06310 [Candidatus Amoebophilus sp.]
MWSGITNITTESDNELIVLLNSIIEEVTNNWANQNHKISQEKNEELRNLISEMRWPVRVRGEIKMYLELFSDWLLNAKKYGEQFSNDKAEVLLLAIKSLIPTKLVMEEGAMRNMKRDEIIKSVQSENGNLIGVRDGLLEYFGITEQRNIGAPQFYITNVDWLSIENNICFEGWAWAAVPLGVYRNNRNREEVKVEVEKFKEEYPIMLYQLKKALQSHDFEILDSCGVGLRFKVKYTAESAIKYIENWFKICLLTSVTAILGKKDKKEDKYQGFMQGNQPMTRNFKIGLGEKGAPMVSVEILDSELYNALTTNKEKSYKMLRELIQGLGWTLDSFSGKVLNYTCTRPLWSLIRGLGCWMSETELNGFDSGSCYKGTDFSYRQYVVDRQRATEDPQTNTKIWSAEPQPNSLVYRPDNPNFTELEDVGLHYHIHVYQGEKEDGKFDGGKGFPMSNYPTAAPLWQGFNVYQNIKEK